MNPTVAEQIAVAARELLRQLQDVNTWLTTPAENAARRLDDLLIQIGR